MMLALRNKQTFALLALIILSLLVIAYIILTVAHLHIGQALHVIPNVAIPWY